MVQRYLKFVHGKILYNICGILPIIIILWTLRDLHNRNKLQEYVPKWVLIKSGVYLQVKFSNIHQMNFDNKNNTKLKFLFFLGDETPSRIRFLSCTYPGINFIRL